MRFLIVDDSRAMQSIVKRGLQKAGYKELEIKLASDGFEALDIIRVWKPDLVLSDWHMPEMNGMELLKQIQREMLDIHIGFVTTEESSSRVQEALESGALFVVNKPFTQEELIQAVLPVLQGSVEGEKALGDEDTPPTHRNYILPSASGFAKIVNGISVHEVLVESVEPLQIEKMTLPCVLGLFDDGQSDVIRAVCGLELRAACILGAAMSGVSPEDVQESIQAQTIGKPMLDGCNKLLKVVSAAIYDAETQCDLQLRSVNVVPKLFPKLEDIFSQTHGERSDFEIAVIGYGQGMMTLITA